MTPSDALAHYERVTALAFSQDGRLLASAGADGELRVWRLQPAPELLFAGSWEGKADPWVDDLVEVGLMRFMENDRALFLSGIHTAAVFDFHENAVLRTLPQAGCAGAFLDDGAAVAAGVGWNLLSVVDLSTGVARFVVKLKHVIRRLGVRGEAVLVVLHDGRLAAHSALDGAPLDAGRIRPEDFGPAPEEGPGAPTARATSPDGRHVALGDRQGGVRIVHAADGTAAVVLAPPRPRPTALYGPRAGRIAAIYEGLGAAAWDLDAGRIEAVAPGRWRPVPGPEDAPWIAVGPAGELLRWRDDGEFAEEPGEPAFAASLLAFGEGGEALVALPGDRLAIHARTEERFAPRATGGPFADLLAARPAPGGGFVVALRQELLRVRGREGGLAAEFLHSSLPESTWFDEPLQVGPAGFILAAHEAVPDLLVVDPEGRAFRRRLPVSGIRSLALSPSGRILFAEGPAMEGACFVHVACGGRIRWLRGIEGEIDAARFLSEDELVTACSDGALRVIRSPWGRVVATHRLRRFGATVADTQWRSEAGDGRPAWPAPPAESERIEWRYPDAEIARAPRVKPVFPFHTGAVRAAATSRNGELAASAGGDQALRVWRLKPTPVLLFATIWSGFTFGPSEEPTGFDHIEFLDGDRRLLLGGRWQAALFDVESRRIVRELALAPGVGAVLPDGSAVVAGRGEPQLSVVDLATGRARWTAEFGTAIEVIRVAGGAVVAEGGGTIAAFDPADGRRIEPFARPAPAPPAFVGGEEGGVTLAAADGREAIVLAPPRPRPIGLFGPRHGRFAAIYEGLGAAAWDLDAGRIEAVAPGRWRPVPGPEDAPWIAVGPTGELLRWRDDGEFAEEPGDPAFAASLLAFGEGGEALVAAVDHRLAIHAPADGRFVLRAAGGEFPEPSAVHPAAGGGFLVVLADRIVRLAATAGGELRTETVLTAAPGDPPFEAPFAAEGDVVAVKRRRPGGTLVFRSGGEVHAIHPPGWLEGGYWFAPSGRVLFAASRELPGGEFLHRDCGGVIGELLLHGGPVAAAVYHDENEIVTAAADGALRVVDAPWGWPRSTHQLLRLGPTPAESSWISWRRNDPIAGHGLDPEMLFADSATGELVRAADLRPPPADALSPWDGGRGERL